MFLNFNYRITLSQLFFITVFFYSSVYIFFICSKGNNMLKISSSTSNSHKNQVVFFCKGFSCLLETKNLHQEFMTFPNIFSFLPYLQNDPINLQPVVTVHGKAKGNAFLLQYCMSLIVLCKRST